MSLKALAAKVLQASHLGQPVGQTRDKAPEKCPTWVESLGQRDRLSQAVPPPLHTPLPPDASPLDALAQFERDPRGVMAWLAGQKAEQPEHFLQRWAAVIRAEARQRLGKVAE